jgi:5-formyltetrahydrofolate cyclo-ligase
MDFGSKDELRQHVWNLLEERGLARFPKPCKGRIPNFAGSEKACMRLEELSEFSAGKCIFSAPDYVLTRARELVIQNEKTLAVATPHMKKFLELSNIPETHVKQASSIGGFEKFGKKLGTRIDLIVQGSVAVDRKGNRIGKGSGYGDREFHILGSLNMLRPKAKVVTIVHEEQVFEDFGHLMEEQDVKVDYILTSKGMIQVKKSSILF